MALATCAGGVYGACACVPAAITPVCGNGTIEVPEECDGANVGTSTCATFASGATGVLRCSTTCKFDMMMCVIPGTGGGSGTGASAGGASG